jgi:DNA-binding beta-propeller fold protein YncE
LGPEGYLYVANYSKNLIYKVSATGDKTVFAKSDLLGGPIGLTFNPKTQDMYVANYLKNTVSKVSAKGEVSTIANGLSKPYNLFLDTYNNVLYVGEQETNSISKIELPQL